METVAHGRQRQRTVVVDEVGHGDAEQRAVQAGVQTRDTLTVDDLLGRGQGARVRLLLLDLRARRQGDQGVAVELRGAKSVSVSCWFCRGICPPLPSAHFFPFLFPSLSGVLGDSRVRDSRQGHGEETTTGTSQGVGDIVALLLGHGRRGGGLSRGLGDLLRERISRRGRE